MLLNWRQGASISFSTAWSNLGYLHTAILLAAKCKYANLLPMSCSGEMWKKLKDFLNIIGMQEFSCSDFKVVQITYGFILWAGEFWIGCSVKNWADTHRLKTSLDERGTMTMAFGESNLNNNSEFINCLRKPVDHRTNEVSDIKSYQRFNYFTDCWI